MVTTNFIENKVFDKNSSLFISLSDKKKNNFKCLQEFRERSPVPNIIKQVRQKLGDYSKCKKDDYEGSPVFSTNYSMHYDNQNIYQGPYYQINGNII